MRDIVDNGDGPEGTESIEFADFGIRFAIQDEQGKLTEDHTARLDAFGGTVPNVGDKLAMLWPTSDPNHNETFEVLSRYYVGEFNGDNCWWLIVKVVKPTKTDVSIYRLARAASTRTRRTAAARAVALENAALKALDKSKTSKISVRKK